MRGVLVEVPDSLLVERARHGLDRFDEMWDGELHMPPAPGIDHQRMGGRLYRLLAPVAEARRLEAFYDTDVYRSDHDWRQPDLVFVEPSALVGQRIEGAPSFAIEIRSRPANETYDKLDFYATVGLLELLVIDVATKVVELFVLDDGQLLPAEPDADGWFRSVSLGAAFRTVDAKVEVDVAGTRTLLP